MCLCMCSYVCVCPAPRVLLTGGVMWIPYDQLNKFYSFYMTAAVIISVVGVALELNMS